MWFINLQLLVLIEGYGFLRDKLLIMSSDLRLEDAYGD